MFINEIEKNPIIRTYLYNAYMESVASVHKDHKKWLYSNYIQLIYYSDNKMELSIDYAAPTIFGGCPLLKYNKYYVAGKKVFLQDMINHVKAGQSVYARVDPYYIPYSSSYHKRHDDQDLFIFGYDEEKDQFMVIGYDEETIYVEGEMSSRNLYKGFWNNNGDYYVVAVEPDYEYNFEFDITKVIEMLEDYYYSKDIRDHMEDYLYLPSCDKAFYEWRTTRECIFGMNIYDQILKELMYCKEHNLEIDYRVPYMISEHHKLMKERVAYLIEQGYLAPDEELTMLSNTIKDQSVNLMHMSIKLLFAKKKEKIYDSLLALIEPMKKNDENLVSKMIHGLKQKQMSK